MEVEPSPLPSPGPSVSGLDIRSFRQSVIMKSVLNDSVNHPSHYTRGRIECIDALDAAVARCPPDEAICVANVIKYVWRYNDKTPVESLKKAQWYLDRLIGKVESRYAAGNAGTGGSPS